MSPRHLLISLAGTSLALGSAPALANERVTGIVPEELEALRLTRERFAARSREFAADTTDFLERREADERRRLSQGYDSLINTLDEAEAAQRTAAMREFEAFLEKYPAVAYSSQVRFRLAELYNEAASDAWLAASEEYSRQIDVYEAAIAAGTSLDELEPPGDDPEIDLARSIALYERIIADNRNLPPEQRFESLDGVLYALGWAYNLGSCQQFNPQRGNRAYADLVAWFPDSDLALDAHLFLGNELFDNNKWEAAAAEYRLIVARGPTAKNYDRAVYQLAWAHYKRNEYDDAIRLFGELLDRSEDELREKGTPSLYAPESIQFMAFSFMDIGDQSQTMAEYGPPRTPLQVAQGWFSRSAPREYEWDVYVALAKLITDYELDAPWAIEIYRFVQSDPRWIDRPENPEFQKRVVDLYLQGTSGDPAASAAARLELTERYAIGGSWWNANQTHPDAQAIARKYIEESLLGVAIEYHLNAERTNARDDWSAAADKYKEYLEKFPIADDFYEQQWFMADALSHAGRTEEARQEYESLLRTEKYHPYGDGATFMLLNASYQAMLDSVGAPDQPVAAAGIERTYETPSGKTVDVRVLADAQAAFVSAADNFLARRFGPSPNEKIPDYRKDADERRVAAAYIPGQVLYYANRYDEARPRLMAVIETYPESDEAAYAASLVVNSYLAEGDLALVRTYSQRFATMRLGSAALASAKAEEFSNTLESTAFKMADDLQAAGDHDAAARAYLNFMGEFPKSKYIDLALLRAAYNREQQGKVTEANALYERFIEQFPNHEEARPLYYRIASNYESTFQLDRAVELYSALHKRFPDYVDAPNALFMASFLKVGLGDHAGAARGFEQYAREYPALADREDVIFRAGAEWEKVDADQAVRFYRSYLREFGATNPNHAIEAQHDLARVYERAGNEREAAKARDALLPLYDQIVAGGGRLDAASMDLVAARAFRPLQVEFDRLVSAKLGTNLDNNLALLLEREEALIAFRPKVSAFIQKYPSFEYVTGALYLESEAIAWLSELGLSLSCPDDMGEEECQALMEILEDQVFQKYRDFEDLAITGFEYVVDLAKQQTRWSDWVEKCQAAMNRLRPADYPAGKKEVRDVVDVDPWAPLEPLPAPWGQLPADGGTP